MTDITVDNHVGGLPETVRVTVNRQPVELPAERLTGLEIKEAAIRQHVEIEPSFQLSLKRGDRYEVIGDSDRVEVRRDEEFLAVAPDDNS
jgi:hypothetical protein